MAMLIDHPYYRQGWVMLVHQRFKHMKTDDKMIGRMIDEDDRCPNCGARPMFKNGHGAVWCWNCEFMECPKKEVD